MNRFNKTPKKTLFLIFLISVIVYLVLLYRPIDSPRDLSPEIMARSRQAAAELKKSKLEDLSLEDRLTLLHACFNLEEDDCVLRVGYRVMSNIEDLPEERRLPFKKMIDTAKKRQGLG